MLRRLAHPQTTRQFARSFHNLPLHRPGHQLLSNRLYRPAVSGVTQLPNQWGFRNVVGPRHIPWGGQVAVFHSTRRNEASPLPFFAVMLKVRLLSVRTYADINLTFIDVRFHGARQNLKQSSPITRPFALLQEPQIEKNTSEELARDGRGTAGDPAEDQSEDNPFPRAGYDPHSPLLGNHHCEFGADTSDWAVRFHFVWYARRGYLRDLTSF